MKKVGKALGAGSVAGSAQVTLFIPSVDRDGKKIDQDLWRDEALRTLGRLFRGATAFPPGKGVWRDDARGGELLFDDTVLVTSYADPASLEGSLQPLRRFLHRLGREANQGEIGLVVDGKYYGIVAFDPAGEGGGA